jgi:hypothetical protein
MKYLILLFSIIFAGEIQVSVDKLKIIQGESIMLTISAIDIDEMPSTNLSNLKDFRVISGPNQSTNRSWANGKSSSILSLSWMLIPTRTGKLSIPPLEISYGSDRYISNQIKVEVIKPNQNINKGNSKTDFYIDVSVDKKNPFRGEQVVITYKLYTKVDLASFDITANPKFNDFWVKELSTSNRLQLKQTVISGERWGVAEISKVALYPSTLGQLKIDPLVAQIGIREKSKRNNIFNDPFFFGGNTKTHIVSSNSLEINVKPLPKSNNIPTPYVGKWSIKSKVDNDSITIGDAITLIIEIHGIGNLQTIDMDDFIIPDKLELYDEPVVTLVDKVINNKLGGTKKIEYVLLAYKSGKTEIPPIHLRYFDVNSRTWKESSAKSIPLMIENNGNVEKLVSISPIEKLQVKYIHVKSSSFHKIGKSVISPISIWLVFLSTILFILPYILNVGKKQYHDGEDNRRRRGALKKAIKVLESKSDNSEDIYKSINTAINIYISEKNNVKIERSTIELINEFVKKNFDESKIESIKLILDRGDAVRFSPISHSNATEDKKLVFKLLKEFDNAWN